MGREPGAQVEVVERDDDVIELHPLLPHRAGQAWFWAERWQQMEQQAEDDIVAGWVAGRAGTGCPRGLGNDLELGRA
ncbi:MAG: hypothetical protein ACP5VR_12145 [Acidimicrobiales bacterium]